MRPWCCSGQRRGRLPRLQRRQPPPFAHRQRPRDPPRVVTTPYRASGLVPWPVIPLGASSSGRGSAKGGNRPDPDLRSIWQMSAWHRKRELAVPGSMRFTAEQRIASVKFLDTEPAERGQYPLSAGVVGQEWLLADSCFFTAPSGRRGFGTAASGGGVHDRRPRSGIRASRAARLDPTSQPDPRLKSRGSATQRAATARGSLPASPIVGRMSRIRKHANCALGAAHQRNRGPCRTRRSPPRPRRDLRA